MSETPTIPAGPCCLAQSYLMASLSRSATFQTWVGATSGSESEKAAAALAHIYEVDIPARTKGAEAQTDDELEALRPYALVYTDTERGQGGQIMRGDRVACGTSEVHGGLVVIFQEAVAAEAATSGREIFVRLMNVVAQVMIEVLDQAETAGRLATQHWELKDVGRGKRAEQAGEGDYAEAVVRVEW